jgi:hypothetical protein
MEIYSHVAKTYVDHKAYGGRGRLWEKYEFSQITNSHYSFDDFTELTTFIEGWNAPETLYDLRNI